MQANRTGQTVVIFLSIRTGEDEAGYRAAAEVMETLAREQPGYRGFESTRGADGLGITLSFWADETAAIAWRDEPRHARIREAGRDRWYARYEVIVAEAHRAYAWVRT